MKHTLTALTTFVLIIASAGAAELKIDWQSPDDFRDADYYNHGGSKSKKIVITNLEKFFTKEAERRLAEGAVLELTVTELDLAGDFEPWRNAGWDDVRIVKDIYPATIEFDYKYIGEDGNVISEGSERLRDTLIPRSIVATSMGRTEIFPYVKGLMRNWMRKLSRSK